MSEIPALDALVKLKDDLEGKSEEEILDIISNRTRRMKVDEYNLLPFKEYFSEESTWKIGAKAKGKEGEKQAGNFVFVLECVDVIMEGDEPQAAIQGNMYLLED